MLSGQVFGLDDLSGGSRPRGIPTQVDALRTGFRAGRPPHGRRPSAVPTSGRPWDGGDGPTLRPPHFARRCSSSVATSTGRTARSFGRLALVLTAMSRGKSRTRKRRVPFSTTIVSGRISSYPSPSPSSQRTSSFPRSVCRLMWPLPKSASSFGGSRRLARSSRWYAPWLVSQVSSRAMCPWGAGARCRDLG